MRIGFDIDGVLADMESELVRQAEILFGEAMTRRLQERTAQSTQRPTEETSTASTTTPERPATPPSTVRDDDSSRAPAAPAEGSPDDMPRLTTLNLTSRQQRRLWRHTETIENFWETLQELEPGVIARLSTLAIDRRWEIIFLTKRPGTAGATSQLQSQRWLESKGFRLPSVYVVQGSRGLIAAALGLDIVIDDRPENCLDVVADSKARAILVWRDDENQLPVAARRLGIGTVTSVSECLDILTQVDRPASEERRGMMARVKRLLGLKEPAEV